LSRVAVIAVGGNSLVLDNRRNSFEDQYASILDTSRYIVELVGDGWTVVITHGNGPQVGFSLQRSELARRSVSPVPMDGAVADTQGTLGYQFQQVLGNLFRQRGITKEVATVITQVEVSDQDPAFQNPTKPIGSFMDEATARQRGEQDGWSVMEDAGRGWRRVVPSPRPQSILESPVIATLVAAGVCVICCGGGGIPVLREGDNYVGVAAVIDKDFASALLASEMKADMFLMSTGVSQVSLHFGTPEQQDLSRINLAEARQYLAEGHFKSGSMKPKIEAAIAFVESTGGRAVITSPDRIGDAVLGAAGTEIVP